LRIINTLLMLLVLSIASLSINTSAHHAGPVPAMQQGENEQMFRDGSVDYRGVRFKYDKSLATTVRASIIPASPATKKDGGPPDTVYPRHTAFVLQDTYTSKPVSFIGSEIHIYPVDAYKAVFAKDPKTRQAVATSIARLQEILKKGSPTFTGDVPYLPLPDGYFAFRSHVAIVKFPHGSGLVFLTQGQQDEMPVNNQNLSYEFQGITDDGRFYVTAQFPVAAPILAFDRDKANYGGTVKESSCVDCPDHQRFMKEYHAYTANIREKLDALTPEKFQPSLKSFDDLIGSIEITEVGN